MVERMDIFTHASVGIVGAFKDMERKINIKASETFSRVVQNETATCRRFGRGGEKYTDGLMHSASNYVGGEHPIERNLY